MSKDNKTNQWATPAAIVFVGVLLAGSIYFGGGISSSEVADEGNRDSNSHQQAAAAAVNADDFRMPSEDDHIQGPLDAKVTIVEFSDFECPFCGRLHPTLQRAVEENNDVAWVYRHLPLSNHPNARGAAIASECVADLAGNDAFWEATDRFFLDQRSLGNDLYARVASGLGIDEGEFETCLRSRDVAREVEADEREALAAGGRGTPFSVVVTASGELIPFSGALPYESVEQVIEQARAN